ncbi:MAG: Gfo/Idh/MocA family oxidoreductase [Verrucomicrobia bacterium]|nr:Gfo/Idh/MocA family oxidoreductase [Verrucomicrobiota bacterium]
MKKNATSRREFLRTASLATGAATIGFPQILLAQGALNKLNIAQIGAGGKGASDTDCCASENIVALCDADRNQAAGQLRKYPKAKYYQDFRKMLDEIGKSLDAVIVSTPDNLHAAAASLAMRMGKHVYVQKPLTCSVYEARYLRHLAREMNVVTQMGNQGSSESGLRRAVEVIQAGVIGPVREVHVWSNRPIWPQGIDRPKGEDPVPPNLNWDLWIGPAPWRPYKKGVYHPFKWRGWQDFGTGALGDMACHTANMPFRALKLGYPTEIEAESSPMNNETYPLTSKIRFEFPARPGMPPVRFWWYDGNPGEKRVKIYRPGREVTKEVVDMMGKLPGSGCLVIGDNGKLFSPDDYGARFYLCLKGEKEFVDGNKHEATRNIPQRIPRNTYPGGTDKRHHIEWLEAIKQGNPGLCYSRFDIAAYLTEIILLGCVALRARQKLVWDGPNMRAVNTRVADKYVKRMFRAGWRLY